MQTYKPLEVTLLRHFFALVPLLVYLAVSTQRKQWLSWLKKISLKNDYRIFVLGIVTFLISPLLQMTGLYQSRAVDGALMIAVEPLATILLAVVFLRERLKPMQILCLCLAATGAAIVSEVTLEKLQSLKDTRMLGNGLILLSLFCEGAYSILAKPLLAKRKPVHVFATALALGTVLLFLFNLIQDGAERLSGLAVLVHQGTLWHWLGFSFLGLGCSLFAYLYWMSALKEAPISLIAMTLYVQPVLGLVWGGVFMQEPLAPQTFLGAALIFLAVAFSNKKAARHS